MTIILPELGKCKKMKVSLFSVVLGPGLSWRRGPTLTDLEMRRHIQFFFFFFEFFQVPYITNEPSIFKKRLSYFF